MDRHQTTVEAHVAPKVTITELLHRYGFAIDDKDWSALADIFTDACVTDYGQFGSFEGVEPLARWMAEAHVGLTTQHAMANITIAMGHGSEPDRATVRSYVTVTLQPEDAPMFRTGGEYRDVVERVDGVWRIAKRDYRTIWQQP